MLVELGCGNAPQKVEIPDSCKIELLLPNSASTGLAPDKELERALDEPIGAAPLEQLAVGKRRVVIITSDITRPCPSYVILPSILKRLYMAGVKAEEITIVLALGSHRGHTRAELDALLGKDIVDSIRCVDSGSCEFIHMGTTTRGTPVDIAKPVAEADFLICVGNIEYHYFAGYSGGAKAVMPGVSTKEAIQKNHSLMTLPGAVAGNLDTNPIREDIEEAGAICKIDYIVNCVLDEHKKIVGVFAGDAVAAHRAGCRFLDTLYRAELTQRADIVLCSQGGAPKDINLYQTQKALDNAKHAVRDGGTVILLGECREGLGNAVFADWMISAKTPDELISRIEKDFTLGGHKAAAIALVLRKAKISLVSSLDESLVESIFMKPYSSAQKALDDALSEYGESASIAIIPYAGSTLPVIK